MFASIRAFGRSLVVVGVASLAFGTAAFAAPVPAENPAVADESPALAAPLCVFYLSGAAAGAGPAPALLGLVAFAAPDAPPAGGESFDEWLGALFGDGQRFAPAGGDALSAAFGIQAAPSAASQRPTPRILWTE